VGRIKANKENLEMMARLMRAEAEGEGDLGMLMVGNVITNRIVANCGEFKGLRAVTDIVNRDLSNKCRTGFEAVCKPYFWQGAREKEVRLARRVVQGERQHPATNSLWFFRPPGATCPSTWWGRPLVAKYKNHCFYLADASVCPLVF
jgi:N-acetylmuramoyl-L-alanine amidase